MGKGDAAPPPPPPNKGDGNQPSVGVPEAAVCRGKGCSLGERGAWAGAPLGNAQELACTWDGGLAGWLAVCGTEAAAVGGARMISSPSTVDMKCKHWHPTGGGVSGGILKNTQGDRLQNEMSFQRMAVEGSSLIDGIGWGAIFWLAGK